MSILISFANLCLYIAIVLFAAYVILWIVKDWFGVTVDANVLKFGQIIVLLICLIAVLIWLAGILGGGPGLPTFWHYR